MKTYVGMSYEEWQKASGVKSEVQRESERSAFERDAHQGMTGREIDNYTPPLGRNRPGILGQYGIWEKE